MALLEEALRNQKTPLIFAHRGSQKINQFPENTIPAFQEAVELGSDGIELDIRLTRDGEPVVFHDNSLKRLLGRDDRLESLDTREIGELNFSHQSKIQIPHLAQVFNKFGKSVYYNLEIKKRFSGYTKLIEKLDRQIQKFDLDKHVLISGFDPIFLWRWKRLTQGIPTAFIFAKWNKFTKFISKRDFVNWLNPSTSVISDLAEIKKCGKPICVWTVNERIDLNAVLKHHVAAIITDEIEFVKSAIFNEA